MGHLQDMQKRDIITGQISLICLGNFLHLSKKKFNNINKMIFIADALMYMYFVLLHA